MRQIALTEKRLFSTPILNILVQRLEVIREILDFGIWWNHAMKSSQITQPLPMSLVYHRFGHNEI